MKKRTVKRTKKSSRRTVKNKQKGGLLGIRCLSYSDILIKNEKGIETLRKNVPDSYIFEILKKKPEELYNFENNYKISEGCYGMHKKEITKKVPYKIFLKFINYSDDFEKKKEIEENNENKKPVFNNILKNIYIYFKSEEPLEEKPLENVIIIDYIDFFYSESYLFYHIINKKNVNINNLFLLINEYIFDIYVSYNGAILYEKKFEIYQNQVIAVMNLVIVLRTLTVDFLKTFQKSVESSINSFSYYDRISNERAYYCLRTVQEAIRLIIEIKEKNEEKQNNIPPPKPPRNLEKKYNEVQGNTTDNQETPVVEPVNNDIESSSGEDISFYLIIYKIIVIFYQNDKIDIFNKNKMLNELITNIYNICKKNKEENKEDIKNLIDILKKFENDYYIEELKYKDNEVRLSNFIENNLQNNNLQNNNLNCDYFKDPRIFFDSKGYKKYKEYNEKKITEKTKELDEEKIIEIMKILNKINRNTKIIPQNLIPYNNNQNNIESVKPQRKTQFFKKETPIISLGIENPQSVTVPLYQVNNAQSTRQTKNVKNSIITNPDNPDEELNYLPTKGRRNTGFNPEKFNNNLNEEFL